MIIRGIPAALVALMLCLVPVAQAWGSTPYQSLDAPDIVLPAPPSFGLTEQQADLLSNVQGHFVENLGQYGPGAGMFYAVGDPLSVALGSGWVSFYHIGDGTGEGAMVRMDLLGAKGVDPIGVDPLSYPTNYLKGNDPDKWVVGARSFREVHYREVYDGIDLVYRFDAGMLKYDIHVEPHADISQVKMGYSGHDSLRVDSVTGDLVIQTPVADLIDRAPVSYQDNATACDKISTRFILVDEGTISFDVTGHDPGLPLVIDPLLPVFSTFVGGSVNESLWDLLIDEGDILVCGATQSTDFPTTPGVISENYMLNDDGYIFKLKEDGSDLIFSTFIGGSGLDIATHMALDKDRNIVVTGHSGSSEFPTTTGAYKDTLEYSGEIFVIKLDNDCTKVIWGTFLVKGVLGSIAVMSNGDIMVAGATQETSFTSVPGCYDDTHNGGGDDLILIRLDPNGTRIIKWTFIGGSGSDATGVAGMKIDAHDNVFALIYTTTSTDLPVTPDAYSKVYSGGGDGAIFKIDGDLSELEYMTYLGGTGNDGASEIDIDASGAVYIIGTTDSSDFPTTDGAYDRTHNSPGVNDAFITKLAPNGSSLSFSTFIGGRSGDVGVSLRIGSDGLVYYAIMTESTLMPTTKVETDGTYGGMGDVYIGVLDEQDQSIRYGTYIGGMYSEGQYLSMDLSGSDVVVVGSTGSPLFPTTMGAYDRTYNGYFDMFVTRLAPKLVKTSPPSPPLNLKAIQEGRSVSLDWDRPIDDGNLNLWPYQVHRGMSPGNFPDTWDVPPWFTEWNDTLPEDGVTFYYVVTAVNPAGETRSNIVNVINATRPDPPLDLTAEAGCGTVMLTWSVPAYTGGLPILGYHIRRGTDPDDLVHLRTVTDGLSFEDEGLVNGDHYYYSISAFNDIGDSLFSPAISALPVGPPGAPQGLYITAGDGMLNLWWRRPINDGGRTFTGYQVLRGIDRNALTIVAQVGNSTTSYVDSPLVNGVTYYYAVRAVNEEGEGVLSPIVSRAPTGQPGAPMNLTGLANIGEVELSWEPSGSDIGSTLVRYSLFKGTSENGLEHLVDVNGNTTSYVDRDLEYGRMTYYTVSATNQFGDGPISSIIPIWPVKLPDPPGNLHARGDHESVTLTWQDPMDESGSDVIGYVIYRGVSADDLSVIDTVTDGSNSFTDTRTADVQVYYYKVATVTAIGEGRMSALVSAVPFTYPSEPTFLSASRSGRFVELSWNPPDEMGGSRLLLYRIYRGNDPDLMRLYTEVVDRTTYLDDNLSLGLLFHYSVSAVTQAGEGPRSTAVMFDPSVLVDKPGPPEALVATQDGGSVILSWRPPKSDGGSHLTGYVIYRGRSPVHMDKIVGRVGETILTCRDDSPENDRTYHYCVAAESYLGGEGERSRPADIHVLFDDPGNAFTSSFILIVAIVCASIVSMGAILSTEPGRYKWGLLLGPLTSRLKRDEVLDNKTRHALLGIIITNPGIHYKAIMREFGLKNGVAAYHLQVLEREDFIRSVNDGRLKRFYSKETKIPKNMRLTPDEIKETVIELVGVRPGISQKEIMNELGIDRGTLRYHLGVLDEEGTLRKAHEGNRATYFSKRST